MMTNLYSQLSRARPDHVAVFYNGEAVSYGEFYALVDRYAASLEDMGFRQGDVVRLPFAAKLDFLAAWYGCLRQGVVAVPVSDENLEAMATLLDALQVGAAMVEQPPLAVPQSEPYTDERAIVIPTSGTTSGRSKGVILGQAGMSSTSAFMNRSMMVDATIREYVLAPLDHAFALGRCHAVLTAGGSLFLDDGAPNYRRLFRAMDDHDCNAISVVPAVLASLLRLGEKTLRENQHKIKWIQTGAMRLDLSYRDKLCEALPNTRVCLHYGLSEAMRATFYDMNEFPHKRHTEGPPADGVEIGIFSPEGKRLANGEEGQIRIRGSNLAIGYTNQAQWETSNRDGWFLTSDRGKLDEDGFLVFLGRSDDAISTNGFIVHPQLVESKLSEVLNDQFYCVVGVDDPDGLRQKLIVLCVEGSTALGLSDLKPLFSASEQHMLPDRIVALDELPRTRTGKLQRAQLVNSLQSRSEFVSRA